MKSLAILFISLFAIAAVASVKTESESSSFSQYDSVEDTLSINRGRELFAANCFNCHQTYISHHRTPEGWKDVIGWMAHNTQMDSIQTADVVNYVVAELALTDTSYKQPTYGSYGRYGW